MRILDVRHEATAVFAAEATGKLTRRPGFAVLTAGPGVTNGVSALAQARLAGSPLVVLGGRAAAVHWGMGGLQELDHPAVVGPVTKLATTAASPADVPATVQQCFRAASTAHRGPAFVDVPIDYFFAPLGPDAVPEPTQPAADDPDPEAVASVADLLAESARPVLVLGTDVWADGAEEAALRLVEETGLPVITNGMARGVIPAGHPQLVTRARTAAFGGCDLVVVVGTPLDFRLGYGRFGGKGGAQPAKVVHIADSAEQISRHVDLAAAVSGDLPTALAGLLDALTAPDAGSTQATGWGDWLWQLQQATKAAQARDEDLLHADADPIHPARVYGDLLPRLADDGVLIGDGGDFVSFAGKFVEPARPGGWLDPGPFGCLGAGLGAAIAARLERPSAQVVLLLGDGAAGFSLMDVDTLVRHRLPVVMVVGNNSGWGLEKHPMRMLLGYDVAADLGEETRYDEVVRALGGAGETVTTAAQIGPALDRAFSAGVPYLVNVITDPEVAYPRSTFGV